MNKKVEFLVGVFLAESEIITHEIPVTIIKKPRTKNQEQKNKQSPSPKVKRKTEHTTKKRNKPEIIDSNE